MSDQVKFYLQTVVAVIGAISASLSQYYTAEDMPEAVRVSMLIGGVVAAVLGSLMAKQSFTRARLMDVDGDGDMDVVIETEPKKEEEK